MKKIFTVAVAVVAFAMFFLGTLYFTSWEDIPTGLGGEEVSHDESGNRCWHFAVTNELICYEEFSTWYGEDAVPLYVINDGGYTPIERSRKY